MDADWDNLTLDELYKLQSDLNNEIASRQGINIIFDIVDREFLRTSNSLVYRTKYLVDKYKVTVGQAKGMVQAWDKTHR
jgi:hypothetical protein